MNKVSLTKKQVNRMLKAIYKGGVSVIPVSMLNTFRGFVSKEKAKCIEYKIEADEVKIQLENK